MILKWAEDMNTYFFQRRHTHGQQVHEKMVNITNYQGKTNKDHNEISLYTCQNDYYHKEGVTIVAENVEKGKPSCIVGGNVN